MEIVSIKHICLLSWIIKIMSASGAKVLYIYMKQVYIYIGKQDHDQDNEYTHIPQKFPQAPLQSHSPTCPHPTASPRQPLICFLSARVSWHLLEFKINGITYSMYSSLSGSFHSAFILPRHCVCIHSLTHVLSEQCFTVHGSSKLIYLLTCWITFGLFPVLPFQVKPL